ncbi:MAG: SRPBCC family protein [Muribaculaceae bacterium]|nr:SRPBCC family protein [Muribaculaceae bacterium]MDE6197607.1 SRPBCC family protein [Muribaculaceae bacterium]
MAAYSSKATVVNRPAAELTARFSDFTALQAALDNLDAEQRAAVGDVAFTEDSIKITTPQVGEIVLKAVERTPERIRLEAQHSPVPMNLIVDFKPVGEESTEVKGTIDVDLPMMLRPLVGPTLQKAADQFGQLFARLA